MYFIRLHAAQAERGKLRFPVISHRALKSNRYDTTKLHTQITRLQTFIQPTIKRVLRHFQSKIVCQYLCGIVTHIWSWLMHLIKSNFRVQIAQVTCVQFMPDFVRFFSSRREKSEGKCKKLKNNTLPLKSNYQKILIDCPRDIKCWMSENFLQLNNDKREVIIFAHSDTKRDIAKKFGQLSTNITKH